MAVEITYSSREFDEIEKYMLTISPEIVSMKEVEDNTVINVDGFLEFKDIKDNGESSDIMSILSQEGLVYALQSNTFKNSMHDIFNIMNGKSFPIRKISGKTKAGRDYINCILDIASLRK